MGNPNYRIEKATLMKDINKYYPGEAPFYIPAVIPYSTKATVTTNTSKSANKGKYKTNSISSEACITMRVPKDIVRDYKSKIIPSGTEFYVAFIGGDMNKPRIIGMG